jgi:hypothetical protein
MVGHKMRSDIYLIRWSGIGDVLMALCAAHAYGALNGGAVFFVTAPALRPLAECCPWVTVVDAVPLGATAPVVDLSECAHGIGPEHEVDSMCRRLGLTDVLPIHKSLDLNITGSGPAWMYDALGGNELSSVMDNPFARLILIHPGVTDPNRTWSQHYWEVLVHQLLLDGHVVALIGGEKEGQRLQSWKVGDPGAGRLVDLIGKLSLVDTLRVMRMADVLVSADAGPVQLAGASDAAIVGLYTVVSGARRAPYRHGTLGWRFRSVPPACHYFPCYREIKNPSVWPEQRDRLVAEGHLSLGAQFAHWCLRSAPTRYSCMREDITPARVYSAVVNIIGDLS